MRGKGSPEPQHTQKGVQIDSWLFNCFYGHQLTFDRFFGRWTSNATSIDEQKVCLLYTSPSPRDVEESRMPSSA